MKRACPIEKVFSEYEYEYEQGASRYFGIA